MTSPKCVAVVLVDVNGSQWTLDLRDVDPHRLHGLSADILTLTGKRYWEVHPPPPPPKTDQVSASFATVRQMYAAGEISAQAVGTLASSAGVTVTELLGEGG